MLSVSVFRGEGMRKDTLGALSALSEYTQPPSLTWGSSYLGSDSERPSESIPPLAVGQRGTVESPGASDSQAGRTGNRINSQRSF